MSLDTKREQLVAALQALKTGDGDALRTVYEMTSAKLFGVCLRICNNREAAEDVLQEVYIKISRTAGGFDPTMASPITWLATIARNSAIDWHRATGRVAYVGQKHADTIPDEVPLADEAIVADEESAMIHYCLEKLSEKENGAVRSAFFDGFTYAQLAEAAAIPLGTMKSRIRRALMKLRDCLTNG